MYKDPSSSSGSGTSTKGDEVELVSRFLAPLCARDETARNIALAAARTTVEGWLGGVGSPNQWDDTTEIENTSEEYGKFKVHQDGRYDMSIERSPRKSVPKLSDNSHNDHPHRNYQPVLNPLQDAFRIEGFFPQSVTDNPSAFIRENSLDPVEKCPSGSYDCIDGRLGNDTWIYGTAKERWPRQSSGVMGLSETLVEKLGRSNSSDEGKGFNIDERARRFRENSIIETRFSSSNESERKFIGYGTTSREMYDEACNDETKQQRLGKNFGKIKGARQKQLEDDDLDSDTRIYGKSPKFDESHGGNFGPYESLSKGATYSGRNENYSTRHDRDLERHDRRNFNVRNGRRFYEYSDEISLEDHHSSRINRNRDGVVFNTLEGFDSENMNAISGNVNDEEVDDDRDDDEEHYLENMNLENPYDENDENVRLEADFGRDPRCSNETISSTTRDTKNQQSGKRGELGEENYMRNSVERKFSAGQIKRPLSQDEDVSSKSGRTLEGPEVTPGDVGRMLNLGNALDGPRQAPPNKYLSLVSLHLPVILRLSVNCPFENVRIKCAEILLMVKDRGLPVPEPAFDGPSAFVPTSELPDLNSLDEKTHMLLMDAFLQNNRLDHVSRVMSSHPSYLEHFLRTQHFVLRGDGPLPYDYRHLIAIMAAGRHQCSYLINLQKGEFILQGGDSLWLQGLRSIPDKLQNLYEINKILAHRPWLLNKTHIEKLTKGADNWSLAEVVHAIVLLAHFHSLSSFVFSCGINEELDNVAGHHYKENVQDNSNTVQPAKDKLISSPKKIPNCGVKTETIPSPPSSPSIVGEQEVGVETLMERMKRLSEKSESYQITQEELSKRFETVETQSAELAAAPQRSSSVLDSDIGLFIEDPTFIYQDFAKRGQLNDIPTFRVQDYSWDDHGYSLVNRLYNDVGNLLDDKFKTAYNLTYYTMGTHNKVDTSRFRRAIWNYIQCMFGIRHDDYDYNEVNQLLERSLKTFIKSAVCYPERVTKRDYDRVMREFKHSEKVHVNLMILEARMQAELLYALRAVMRYMT